MPQDFERRRIGQNDRCILQVDGARAGGEHAHVVAGGGKRKLVLQPGVRIGFDQEDGCVIRRRAGRADRH